MIQNPIAHSTSKPGALNRVHTLTFAVGLAALLLRLLPSPAAGHPVDLYPWAWRTFYACKGAEMRAFAVMLSVVFAYFTAAYEVDVRRPAPFDDGPGRAPSTAGLAVYAVAALAGNAGVCALAMRSAWAAALVWLAGFALPAAWSGFFPALALASAAFERRRALGRALLERLGWAPFVGRLKRWEDALRRRSRAQRLVALAGLAAIGAQFAAGFSGFWSTPLITNDFFDVPEKTILASGPVDDTDFINRHNLSGFLKYDLRLGRLPLREYGITASMPNSPELRSFLDRPDDDMRYAYDAASRALIVFGWMTGYDRDRLKSIGGAAAAAGVELAFRQSQLRPRVRYSADELRFLRANRLELHWQVLNRGPIHHHNFLLSPINELALGRDPREVAAQYGLGNAVLLGRLLDLFGGISYENYFRIFYVFWPAYFVAWAALLGWILDDARWVLAAALAAFACVYAFGYDGLVLAPGWNPARHLWDVPLAACLAAYARRGRRAFFFMGLALCLVAIYCDASFGGCAALAYGAAALAWAWSSRRRAPWAEAIPLMIAATGAALILSRPFGTNPLLNRYFAGLLGFPAGGLFYARMLGALFAGYAVLIWTHKQEPGLRAAALFLFFYGQGMLTYFIWQGTGEHLLNLAPIFVAAAACLLKLWIDGERLKAWENLILASLLASLVFGVYAPESRAFSASRRDYERVFEDHVVWHWDFPRARFASTIDPEYFHEAVDLIRAHSSGARIYLISQYDSLLPFLAERFSGMPFFDLKSYLLGPRELDEAVHAIEAARPGWLFVDTDIERPRGGDVVRDEQNRAIPRNESEARGRAEARDELLEAVGDSGDDLALESRERAARSGLLAEVFARVRSAYVPVARGKLITVYRRRAP